MSVNLDKQLVLDTISDPVAFMRKILKQEPWRIQAEILQAINRSPRVRVKACHSSGKTRLASVAALWWITRYPDGIVITTAPTWNQVKRLLWSEIHRAIRHSLIAYPEPGQTMLQLAPDNYAMGLSTNEGVRFQGFHGRVLIIIDEAPGVATDIYEAIEGVRAGGDVRVLELGNPTISSGAFYDGFTSGRTMPGVELFTISAFDTPNLEGLTIEQLLALPEDELDRNAWPMLTKRRWVKEKYEEWGPKHPLWESRVMGEFPTQSESALISLAWAEQARYRERFDCKNEPAIVGVDVAGPGEDETVCCIRKGQNICGMNAWSKPDPRGELAAFLERENLRKETTTLNVDAIGMGYYLGLHFRDLGWRVNLVNVAEGARNKERFINLKAEYYWGLRQRFESGEIAGLRYDRAIAQLASIQYEHDARGRIVIESKDDMRKRGIKSPDWAEAIMLAFASYSQPSVPLIGGTSTSYWSGAN